MRTERRTDILVFLAAAFCGLAVVSAAPYFTGGTVYTHGFLPWIRTGVEGFSLVSAAGLVTVGLIAGLARPTGAWRWGMATMALFPIWAVIEMTLDPTSHNLWPLEFICYAVESLAGVLGALLGAYVSRLSFRGA